VDPLHHLLAEFIIRPAGETALGRAEGKVC